MKIISLISALIILTPVYADFGDSIAHSMFQQKIDELYQKALTCTPLERDQKSSMDVRDWIKLRPQLPGWTMLAEIEKVARDANAFAKRSTSASKDKRRHCLAGCYVAKKLDKTSAVLVGWYKELADAADCSDKTSFEKLDFVATEKGAQISKSQKSCENFCEK